MENHRFLGNKFYSNGDLNQAIIEYSAGLAQDPTDIKCLTNRALCFMKLNAFEKSYLDSESALVLDNNNIKALFYAASSGSKIGKPSAQVLNYYKKAYSLSLNDASISHKMRMEMCRKYLLLVELNTTHK